MHSARKSDKTHVCFLQVLPLQSAPRMHKPLGPSHSSGLTNRCGEFCDVDISINAIRSDDARAYLGTLTILRRGRATRATWAEGGEETEIKVCDAVTLFRRRPVTPPTPLHACFKPASSSHILVRLSEVANRYINNGLIPDYRSTGEDSCERGIAAPKADIARWVSEASARAPSSSVFLVVILVLAGFPPPSWLGSRLGFGLCLNLGLDRC
jgi:hypothetical protein